MFYRGWKLMGGQLIREFRSNWLGRIATLEFAVGAAGLAIFGWLAVAVMRNKPIWFDTTIREMLRRTGFPVLTRAMQYLTTAGEPSFLLPFMISVVVLLLILRRYRAALMLVVLWAGATALSESLKLVFRRIRPEAFFGYSEPITYSFPSGHAIASTCFYSAVAGVTTANIESGTWKITIWATAALIILLIGCSRIYLGVHYPSDVLAGYALALVWLVSVRTCFRPG